MFDPHESVARAHLESALRTLAAANDGEGTDVKALAAASRHASAAVASLNQAVEAAGGQPPAVATSPSLGRVPSQPPSAVSPEDQVIVALDQLFGGLTAAAPAQPGQPPAPAPAVRQRQPVEVEPPAPDDAPTEGPYTLFVAKEFDGTTYYYAERSPTIIAWVENGGPVPGVLHQRLLDLSEDVSEWVSMLEDDPGYNMRAEMATRTMRYFGDLDAVLHELGPPATTHDDVIVT